MSHRALLVTLTLALVACDNNADDKSPDPSDTTEESDTEGTETDGGGTDDTGEPTFEAGTFQLRVMNLTGEQVTVTGTDADDNPISIVVPAMHFSGYVSLPLGTGVVDYDTPYPLQANLSTIEEFARVITVVGEVSSYPRIVGLREPERTPGSRTFVFGTTGRTVSLTTDDGTTEIPSGEQGEVLRFTHVEPNETELLTWATYGKPFAFHTARIPEDGIGYVVNSDIAGDGFGKYYYATNAPGPVREVRANFPMYAYNADASLAAPVEFIATTPFGDVSIATNVGLHATSALPSAMIPFDTTSVRVTNGTTTVEADFALDPTAEHAIAVLHPGDGTPAIDFLQGEPNDRRATDAYMILKNLTSDNLDARCYWNFGGWQAPGGTIGSTLIAPAAALGSIANQNCNLTAADVPDAPPSTPTHNYAMSTSNLRGYHIGFVENEGDQYRVVWAYRQTDDPNVYMRSTVTSTAPAP